MFSKKRKQIIKNKRKINIGEINSRKAIISSLESFDKKKLPVFIPAIKISKSKVKNINIAIIGADAYCIAYCLKKA